MAIPDHIKVYLGWRFTELLPGTFKRKKKQFAGLEYPILAPLPTAKSKTRPLEECRSDGPFIYFVIDGAGRLCYIGKSQESCVIKRWVRPGIGGPNSHYWTHSVKSGGCVFHIKAGLIEGRGPFTLNYTTYADLLVPYGKQFGISSATENGLELMEDGLIRLLSPIWNR